MRRPHRLRRNKATQIPANCIWLDTETKPRPGPNGEEHHYLWFGWACFQRRRAGLTWTKPEWLRFTTREQLWDWILTKTRPQTRLYLFAHNWTFDGPVIGLFDELPRRGWTIKNAIIEAPPFAVTWKSERMTIQAVDTLNFWRVPLETLGESVGTLKLPMPHANAPPDVWDNYGRNDTEVIRVACLQWFDWLVKNDLGGFALTLAAQSMRSFRHRFMKHEIFIDDHEEATAISRESYVGGRTECFRVGKFEGEFYYVDVNSMYPAVMQEEEFPCKLRGVYGYPDPDEIEKWKGEFALVVQCRVKIDRPIVPLVIDGRLCFPVGEFDVTLAGPEFFLCWERGCVVSMEKAVVYEQAPLFKEFVDYFYGQRLEAQRRGDPAAKFMHRILMNSLSGKTGQRGRVFELLGPAPLSEVSIETIWDADDQKAVTRRRFGGIEQEFQDEGESRDSFPAIASYVCSHARLKLLEGIETAGWRECYYGDTDSLIVTAKGFDRMQSLIDPDKLGAWDVEGEPRELTLFGPKDYQIDGKGKTKGVKRNAVWVDGSTVNQTQFVGFKGLVRRGSLDAPVVMPITKCLKRLYTKGTVLRSGWVRPFRLGG